MAREKEHNLYVREKNAPYDKSATGNTVKTEDFSAYTPETSVKYFKGLMHESMKSGDTRAGIIYLHEPHAVFSYTLTPAPEGPPDAQDFDGYMTALTKKLKVFFDGSKDGAATYDDSECVQTIFPELITAERWAGIT
ncbi:hypothetical protein FH972_025597 [Carpinus fangiana]|uniref:Uncharacterized protein n=1 Tax=Carpinus fangiana TaxID=176857 RepID=A0A5N6L1G8_9ROSI|nr:hypothetical protein FH972_025597 [Carpinus fangiana]